MTSYTPRPYQPGMTDHVLNTRRCALWAFMGAGKCVTTLTAVDIMRLCGEALRVLVIAPLRVARTTWPEAVGAWDHLAHLRVAPIIGTPAERMAAAVRPADVYTVNFENVQWLVNFWKESWPYDCVVIDEATRLKSTRSVQGSKRGEALRDHLLLRTPRVIELTGTPAPNGLQDLYGQIYLLDGGARLGRSYSAFENRWFGFKRVQDALRPDKTYTKRITFPHAQAEIQGLVKDLCFTVLAKDCFTINEPVLHTVRVELPPAARKMYRNMEREMFAEIQGYDVEAFNAGTKSIKCLGLANGAVYTGSDEEVASDTSHWVEVHTEKLDALESIISEADGGGPVLVAYHFKPDLARILKRFPQARHIKTASDEAAFKAGTIPIGVVHAQSIGHGVDGFQRVCNTLIFFAHWWAMEDRAQLIERIGPVRQIQSGNTLADGSNRPVLIYNIVAKDTIDEAVIARVDGKLSVQDALLAYMRQVEPELG
jgi:hypothetical protein